MGAWKYIPLPHLNVHLSDLDIYRIVGEIYPCFHVRLNHQELGHILAESRLVYSNVQIANPQVYLARY